MYQYFNELCKNRHSIRSFTKQPVQIKQIKTILESVQTAPTAGNLQAYKVYVVQKQEVKEEITKAALGQSFIQTAPVVMVFIALKKESAKRYGQRGTDLYAIQDATIACTFAMLGAEAIGLSSTWVGAFNDEELMRILGCSQDEIPIAILPIGNAGKDSYSTPRRGIEDLAVFL